MTVIRTGRSRPSSEATTDGSDPDPVMSSTPESRAASGPAARASGNDAPVARTTSLVPDGATDFDTATAVAYRSRPASRVTGAPDTRTSRLAWSAGTASADPSTVVRTVVAVERPSSPVPTDPAAGAPAQTAGAAPPRAAAAVARTAAVTVTRRVQVPTSPLCTRAP